jgi:5-methylcytosine-specific restriction endonuclease McrA
MDIKEYKKRYYQKNKEKISQKKKEFYQLNKDKIKNYYKERYPKNKIRVKEYQQEHKEEIKHYQKNYILTPNSIYSQIESRIQKTNKDLAITKEEFIKWYNKQEQECHYCKRTLEEIKQDKQERADFKNRLSIDRKDNNKGYTLDNIVLACRRCNIIKGDYFTEQEMLEIGNNLYKGDKNENK